MQLQMIDGTLCYAMHGIIYGDNGEQIPDVSWAPVAFNDQVGSVVRAIDPEYEPLATYSQCRITTADSPETKIQKFLQATGQKAPDSKEEFVNIPFLGVVNLND